MSWRVTLACTRAEAEALPDSEDLFPFAALPPVIVADEPDPAQPDDWRIHAYFADQPSRDDLAALATLAANAPRWETTQADGTPGRSPISLSHVPDWQCYRYRVAETVVPMRNVLWGVP